MFVFASAVVSFRGWPAVGDQAAPIAVSASQVRAASSGRLVKQFIALTAAQTASVTGAAAAPTRAGGLRPTASQRTTAVVASTRLAPQGARRATFASTTGFTPVSSPPSTCSSCGRPTLVATLDATTQAATGSLGNTVASTGNQLGSAVTGFTGTVASNLGAVSAGLGQVVSSAGQALGGTINSATGALGGTLSGGGRGLSGLLIGHRAH